jgi:hypothetical protein
MSVPTGFKACSISAQCVDGFWEIAFAHDDQGPRTVRLRLDLDDIAQLLDVVSEGRHVLKYNQFVRAQERLRTKRRRPRDFTLAGRKVLGLTRRDQSDRL